MTLRIENQQGTHGVDPRAGYLVKILQDSELKDDKRAVRTP